MRLQFILVVEFLLGLVLGTLAQNATTNFDPVKNMCYRWYHQSTVKNGVLYIDGGLETFVNENYQDQTIKGTPTWGYNMDLIAIDMTKSWSFETNISEITINKTENPSTGTTAPSMFHGALYQGASNDSSIWFYGGTTPSVFGPNFPTHENPPSDQYTLWAYDTNSHIWNQYDLNTASQGALMRRPSHGAWAEAPDQGLAFYLNGKVDNSSSYDTAWLGSNSDMLSGMVMIDTNSPDTVRNVSTDGVSSSNARIGASMAYVPGVGEKGVLALIGGGEAPTGTLANVTYGSLVSMDTIDVFDIASIESGGSGWYKQNTSGNFPESRTDFCVVAASAPDNSSHNIFLYGGRNESTAFDDVYVLSLPQFRWTKVYFNGKAPRYGHTCNLVGSRQMVSVGGQESDNLTKDCDWEWTGVGVYDMPTLIWGQVYNASAGAYEVPSLVYQDIGGNAQGNATMRTPAGGFSTPSLASLFYPTSTPTPSPSSTNTNITPGIIAAIVIGILAFTLLLILALYLTRRAPAVRAAWAVYRQSRQPPAEVDGREIEEKDGYPTTPWTLSPSNSAASRWGKSPQARAPVEMMSPTEPVCKEDVAGERGKEGDGSSVADGGEGSEELPMSPSPLVRRGRCVPEMPAESAWCEADREKVEGEGESEREGVGVDGGGGRNEATEGEVQGDDKREKGLC